MFPTVGRTGLVSFPEKACSVRGTASLTMKYPPNAFIDLSAYSSTLILTQRCGRGSRSVPRYNPRSVLRILQLCEERCHETLRLKWQKMLNFLSCAKKLNRHTEIVGHRKSKPTFSST